MSNSMTGCFTCDPILIPSNTHVLTGKFDLTNVNNMAFYISGPKFLFETTEIFDSSEFDSTGVKLYIFIHNEVRDFDKNLTQPSSRQRESTVCRNRTLNKPKFCTNRTSK
jgi:hypothetical protein